MDVLKHLTETPDGEKLIAGAQRLIGSDSFHYCTKALWANYAAQETATLKNPQLPMEERIKAAQVITTRRLALEDLLDEVEGLANTELSSEEPANDGE